MVDTDCVAGYHHLTSLLGEHDAELSVGLYHPEGGCDFEFLISFGCFSNARTPYCKVGLYAGSAQAVTLWPKLFARIGEARRVAGRDPSVEDVVEILNDLGFRDLSKPAQPMRVSLADYSVEESVWLRFLAEADRQMVDPSEYLQELIQGALNAIPV